MSLASSPRGSRAIARIAQNTTPSEAIVILSAEFQNGAGTSFIIPGFDINDQVEDETIKLRATTTMLGMTKITSTSIW
jgi:hypothetical protein